MNSSPLLPRDGGGSNLAPEAVFDELRAVRNDLALLAQKIDSNSPSNSDTPWRIIQRDGVTYFLDARSLVDKCILDTGVWEREQVDFLSALLKKAAVGRDFRFLDIGAYFGYYSLTIKHKFPTARVFSFEANPMTFVQLKANLLCNNLQDEITACNAVVTSERGRTNVANHEGFLDNRGGWSLTYDNGNTGSPVENVVIDDFFPDLRDCWIVIKIDVEGYESKVIPGLRRLVKNNKVILQIECFDFNDDFRGKFVEAIKDLGLFKINQIQYDHYFTNFPAQELVEKPKTINILANKFFTGLNRDDLSNVVFDENNVGHIIYGPCMWVPKGRQKVVLHFSEGTTLNNCKIDVFSNYAHTYGGNGVLHSEEVSKQNYQPETGRLVFTYNHPISFCDIEFRLATEGKDSGKFVRAEIIPQYENFDWW